MKNHKMVAKRRLINHSLAKAEWFIFYCCLLNNIANAIIKATFMIVTPTSPKNSNLVIINNDNSTIDTTSCFNLTVKTVAM